MGAKTILSLLILALLVYKFADIMPSQTGTCRSAGECIDQALKTGDPTNCDALNPIQADLCRMNYYVYVGDIEMCNSLEIPEYASQCVRQIAVDLGESSLCGQVTDRVIRGMCVNNLATSISDCNELGSISAEMISCYATVAGKLGNLGVCFELPRNVRLSDGRPLDPWRLCCDNIKDLDLKAECLERLTREAGEE